MKTYKVSGPSTSGTGNAAIGSGGQTAVNVIGATTFRPLVNYLLFGFRTNP